MKPPPDEKAVETLRAATQGRKARGKWRIVAAVVATIALLLAGSLAVFEGTRQSEIAQANADAQREADRINEYFAGVTDWPKWYRDRQPKNWGGDKFTEWVTQSQPAVERHGDS